MSGADSPSTPETITDIAVRYGVARSTVSIKWSLRPDWPPPVGQRGHAYLYDPAAVDAWVATRSGAPPAAATWVPEGLYSLRDIAAGLGVSPSLVRSRLYAGRWPQADDHTGVTHLWFGSTVARAAAQMRIRPSSRRNCT